jgi:hypothetical protein
MAIYRLGWKLHRNQVRLLLYQGNREILRARLPQPEDLSCVQPTNALLESLALWLNTTLRVVLCADDPCCGFYLGLTDELGTGIRTPYYEVSVVAPVDLPSNPSRLQPDGEFDNIVQLCFSMPQARR